MTRLAPTLRPVFAAVCLGLCLGAAGCSRAVRRTGAAQATATVSVTVAPVQGVDEPVTIEATGSFQAEESSDVAPEASGRVIATPVDVGQFVQHRRGAGPAPGRRRRPAPRREPRRRRARRSQREAGRIAERAGPDDRAALRGAAGDRRRLANGRRSGAHAGRDLACRTSPPRARRSPRPARSWRWRRRRSPTSSSPRRSPAISASARCRSASTCSRRPRSSRCSRSIRCGCS